MVEFVHSFPKPDSEVIQHHQCVVIALEITSGQKTVADTVCRAGINQCTCCGQRFIICLPGACLKALLRLNDKAGTSKWLL